MNRPLKILWAGTFSLRKGAHYFLQAINLIPKAIDLDIVVYGKHDMPKAISATVGRPIAFRPTLPRAELLKQYRLADVAVLPTLSDAYAMVTTEAMSQGLPVITTERNGASDVIKSGENGFITPAGDAEALARAIIWCGNNRSALPRIGMRARETAKSWQWHHYRAAIADMLAGFIPDVVPSPVQ
jgi:glycosyltransferase involved in cell wall biosynthesis